MTQSISAERKHCDRKQDKAANKDKKHSAWQIVKPSTGQILQGLNYNGNHGTVDFAGQRWAHVSAFAWTDGGAKVIPHFNEQAAKDMLKLYTAQTGDLDAQVIKIMVA